MLQYNNRDHQSKSKLRKTNVSSLQQNELAAATCDFHPTILSALLQCISKKDITLEQITLACYTVFLFKLTNGERRFSIKRIVDSERDSTEHGMTDRQKNIPTIEFDLLIDPSLSFHSLLQQCMQLARQWTESVDLSRTAEEYPGPARGVHQRTVISLDNRFPTVLHLSSEEIIETELSVDSRITFIIRYDQQRKKVDSTFKGSCSLFNENTVHDLSHRFHSLCQQIFGSSSSFNLRTQPIYELSIRLPTEEKMLHLLNKSTSTSNDVPCIHQAFVERVRTNPNKIAITLDEQSLTYSQLFDRVQQVTFFLINHHQIQPGDVICQCIDRSFQMIVGILATMLAGAVYAPLNPSDPIDRLHTLAHQVNTKLILTDQNSPFDQHHIDIPIVKITDTMNPVQKLDDTQIEKLSSVSLTSDSLSHIVFTSGSTGTPKAVQIRHRNFMSYVNQHFIQDEDIVLQLASCSFDVHLDEILSALVRGAQLVLLRSGGHLDFDYITRTVHDNRVTFVAPVPSWLSSLAMYLKQNGNACERVKSVRWWFIGGSLF